MGRCGPSRFEHCDPDSFAFSELVVWENCWKESRGLADLVILVNIDQFLYHPMGRQYLVESSKLGLTMVPPKGYQMVASNFPSLQPPLHTQIRQGYRWIPMDKLALFNPDAIESMGYSTGRHQANPKGDLRAPRRQELMLLHYKYLGFEYRRSRLEHLRSGFGKTDIELHLGHQYFWNPEEMETDFNQTLRKPERSLACIRGCADTGKG